MIRLKEIFKIRYFKKYFDCEIVKKVAIMKFFRQMHHVISALDGLDIDYDTFALLLGLAAAVAGYALYQVILTKGRRKRSLEYEESFPTRMVNAISDLVWHGK